MRRWAPFINLIVALAACTAERSIGELRETQHEPVDIDKLDVLFVVDDSDSMAEEQAMYLPVLVRQLEELRGGLPSLHIGVISTDLGMWPHNAEQCSFHGKGGALQNEPRIAGCTPPRGAFISDEIGPGGERVRNYAGSLADSFACISRLGNQGCGIEQPLAAMRAALDGSVAKNDGFLRADAFLAIVILADEDDCSASNPEIVFDPALALDNVDSPVGPFSSYRCTRFGITCNDGPPESLGPHLGCVPRNDAYITHTDEFVEFLEGIKDPSTLLVTVVVGAPDPVVSALSSTGALKLEPSCQSQMGTADPAVRLAHFAESFPNHAMSSICDGENARAAFALGGDVRQLISTYERDHRGDLDISYGCGLARGGTGGAWPMLLIAAALIICTRAPARRLEARPKRRQDKPMADKLTLTDEEWRRRLTSEEYQVLRRHGTERAGSGCFLGTKDPGTYVCAGCGNPLFASGTKFESGTGWPSFTAPLSSDALTTIEDHAYGMVRTEVRCGRCEGHLGHVFPDGPAPTGQRYCMNSVAMRHVPEGQEIRLVDA